MARIDSLLDSPAAKDADLVLTTAGIILFVMFVGIFLTIILVGNQKTKKKSKPSNYQKAIKALENRVPRDNSHPRKKEYEDKITNLFTFRNLYRTFLILTGRWFFVMLDIIFGGKDNQKEDDKYNSKEELDNNYSQEHRFSDTYTENDINTNTELEPLENYPHNQIYPCSVCSRLYKEEQLITLDNKDICQRCTSSRKEI